MRRKAEFDAVFAENRSRSDSFLVVYLMMRRPPGSAENTLPPEGAENAVLPSRIGLVVGRKVGNAVVRNRVKRLIREAFRLSQHELPAGLDIVVLPRPATVAELSLVQLRKSLGKLARLPLPARQAPRPPRKRRSAPAKKKSPGA